MAQGIAAPLHEPFDGACLLVKLGAFAALADHERRAEHRAWLTRRAERP